MSNPQGDRFGFLWYVLSCPSPPTIKEWNYRVEGDGVRHVGPTAQDFHTLFGAGGGDKSISTIDPAGIALAAIQELDRHMKEIDELLRELNEMQKILTQLVAERQ